MRIRASTPSLRKYIGSGHQQRLDLTGLNGFLVVGQPTVTTQILSSSASRHPSPEAEGLKACVMCPQLPRVLSFARRATVGMSPPPLVIMAPWSACAVSQHFFSFSSSSLFFFFSFPFSHGFNWLRSVHFHYYYYYCH